MRGRCGEGEYADEDVTPVCTSCPSGQSHDLRAATSQSACSLCTSCGTADTETCLIPRDASCAQCPEDMVLFLKEGSAVLSLSVAQIDGWPALPSSSVAQHRAKMLSSRCAYCPNLGEFPDTDRASCESFGSGDFNAVKANPDGSISPPCAVTLPFLFRVTPASTLRRAYQVSWIVRPGGGRREVGSTC